MVRGMSRRARMQMVLFGCAAPTEFAARCNSGHGPISTNAATVPGIYAKLIDVDKVDLLMGHATNLIVAAMPLIIERKKLVMMLLALGSNAEFKYPRYFQSAAFGPDSRGVLSNNFFAVAKSLAPEPKTVALVGADAEFSNNVLIGARENAKKYGLKIVYDRSYPPATV